MPLLVADKVSYQINQLQILDQISFAVGQGEVVGIIGPNGAGKNHPTKMSTRSSQR